MENSSTCGVSSIRFKENVKELTYGLDELMQLTPKFFNYKESYDAQDRRRKIGFIAEDVELIIPEVVNYDEEGLAYNIDYPFLTSLLTKSVQDIVSVLDIINAPTSLPAIVINGEGNIRMNALAISQIDVAENYPTSDVTLESGHLVALDPDQPGYIKRADTPYDPNLIGVISTAPGVLLGRTIENSKPVALAGRVPVKVTDENGPIKIGDPITASSYPGVGMKAMKSGRIIGYALENFNDTFGHIYVFINVSDYYLPAVPAHAGQAGVAEAEGFIGSLLDAVKSAFNELGIWIEEGILQAKEIVVDVLRVRKIVTESFEMKDSATGEMYCIRIFNGQWDKVRGECGTNTDVNTPDSTDVNVESDSTTADTAVESDSTSTTGDSGESMSTSTDANVTDETTAVEFDSTAVESDLTSDNATSSADMNTDSSSSSNDSTDGVSSASSTPEVATSSVQSDVNVEASSTPVVDALSDTTSPTEENATGTAL